MHKEGVVIKVTDQYIVLLCNDGTFQNVKRAKGLVPLIGEKLDVRQKRNIYSFGYFSSVAAIACVALFLFFSFGRFNKIDAELAYVIAIDINPSIEVQVNEELYTIGLTALNQSGEKITNAIEYKGKRLDETIDLIISQSAINGFLNQTDTGLITSSIVPMNDKLKIDKDKVKTFINDSLVKNKIKAEVQIALDKKETLESAHTFGVTVNKYRIYRSLIDSGLSVTVEEVKENSIRDLLELKEKHNIIQKNKAEVLKNDNQRLNNKDTKLEEPVSTENMPEQKEESRNDNSNKNTENNKDEKADNPAPKDNSPENKDKKNAVEDKKKLGEDTIEFENPAEVEAKDEYPEENRDLEKNDEMIETDTNNKGKQENPSIDTNEQNDNEKSEGRQSNEENSNDEKADSKLIKPSIKVLR